MGGGTILALDLSTHVGWCVGRRGEAPRFGVCHLGKPGNSRAKRYAALDDFMRDAIKVHQPTEIYIEAPLMHSAARSDDTTRLTIGLIAVAELVAHDHSLPILDVRVDTARMRVIGKCRWEKGKAKEHVLAWCRGKGYRVQDDNAADALIVWLSVVGPSQAQLGLTGEPAPTWNLPA